MLTLLASLGCDLNVKNKHDETPIEMIFDLGTAFIKPLLDGLGDLDQNFIIQVKIRHFVK